MSRITSCFIFAKKKGRHLCQKKGRSDGHSSTRAPKNINKDGGECCAGGAEATERRPDVGPRAGCLFGPEG